MPIDFSIFWLNGEENYFIEKYREKCVINVCSLKVKRNRVPRYENMRFAHTFNDFNLQYVHKPFSD
jgi:hypothetical protein